mgnify:CR=1 FL=1|jgi:DNA-methyltransferase (dcm)
MGGTLALGSLCTGYGGLDLAVGAVLPVRHAWHAEIDPDASRVLAAHWPDVPNLGDLREVDWSRAEPVDVLTAGFPCQPVSAAGRRMGVADERWLFDDIADAVGRLVARPRLLVFENVPGLLTASRGDAMARVVQGLARLGYVGRYGTFRASDVGAPHRRARVFIVAWPAEAGCPPDGTLPAGRVGFGAAGPAGVTLLPTPNAALGRGTGTPSPETAAARYAVGKRFLDDAVSLLPTPAARDWRSGGSNIMDRNARPLNEVAVNLLPTPTTSDVRGPGAHGDGGPDLRSATDGTKGGPNQRGSSGDLALPSAVVQFLPTPVAAYADRWGEYAPAIRRWEQITGRPAPEPTEPGTRGQPRLSPRFVEWLMGLDSGWVTDHLPRTAALRVLGNGVVPQQGAAALATLTQPAPASPATTHQETTR